mmetsp:Transcript_32412/g.89589  ORF Transcript_32412/g.89589 Transcript_32412/m.89589 type:complete len:208 (+) Transcript_32412:367-990(+)
MRWVVPRSLAVALRCRREALAPEVRATKCPRCPSIVGCPIHGEPLLANVAPEPQVEALALGAPAPCCSPRSRPAWVPVYRRTPFRLADETEVPAGELFRCESVERELRHLEPIRALVATKPKVYVLRLRLSLKLRLSRPSPGYIPHAGVLSGRGPFASGRRALGARLGSASRLRSSASSPNCTPSWSCFFSTESGQRITMPRDLFRG